MLPVRLWPMNFLWMWPGWTTRPGWSPSKPVAVNDSRLKQQERWQTNWPWLLSRGMQAKLNGFQSAVRSCSGGSWCSLFCDCCPALHFLGEWSCTCLSEEEVGRKNRDAQALVSKLLFTTTQGRLTAADAEGLQRCTDYCNVEDAWATSVLMASHHQL